MNTELVHDILLIVFGGVFGVCLGKVPQWAFYSVLGVAILLTLLLLR